MNDKCDQVASPSITSTTNEEECLISAWSSVSRGSTDSLSRDELVQVFQYVGLENGSEEASINFLFNNKLYLIELLLKFCCRQHKKFLKNLNLKRMEELHCKNY